MHEPSYRNALVRAWALVRHHKSTWALGLLSVFVGQLGLANFIGYFLERGFNPEPWWQPSWGVIRITTLTEFIWFLWIVGIALAFAIFILFAALCAQGALVAIATHWFHTHTTLSLHHAWQRGVKHFWTILTINVLEKIGVAIIFMVMLMLLPLLSLETWGGFFGTIGIVSLSLFMAFIITTVAIYSLGYAVTDELAVVPAVDRAWRLFKNHLLVSLELNIILVLFNFIIVAVLSASSVVALIPTALLSITAGLTGYSSFITVAVVLYFFLLIAIAIMVGAIFNAFTTSSWMYLFMKMHHEGVTSRFGHYLRKLFGKN